MVFFLGIALFFGVHGLGFSPRFRGQLVTKLGQPTYLGLYTLCSIAGLVGIVAGFDSNSRLELSIPAGSAVYAYSQYWMFLSFWLLISANLPTYLKRWTRHPMTWGIVIWGLGHMLVNPDVHSWVLFGTFLLFVVVSAMTSATRDKQVGVSNPKAVLDLASLGLALLMTYLALQFHGSFTGVTLTF
jgi:uncharacterized membrane protein